MKKELSRSELLDEYYQSSEDALFSQQTIAVIRRCSISTVEHDRLSGNGVPFIKIGRLVRYRKSDIKQWLEKFQAMQSTAEADMKK